jgi:hypothetical protein
LYRAVLNSLSLGRAALFDLARRNMYSTPSGPAQEIFSLQRWLLVRERRLSHSVMAALVAAIHAHPRKAAGRVARKADG